MDSYSYLYRAVVNGVTVAHRLFSRDAAEVASVYRRLGANVRVDRVPMNGLYFGGGLYDSPLSVSALRPT